MRKWLKQRFHEKDDELREELAYHLDRRAAETDPASARRAFGNPTQAYEDLRAMNIPVWFESLMQDLTYALRGLRRAPAFALASTLALALGIGSTTAVFSVVDRLLLRPLPVQDEASLVSLGMSAPIEPNEWLLGPDYILWRDKQTAFRSMTSTTGRRDCDLLEEKPVRLSCVDVESTFLSTMGIQPALGRSFTHEEDLPGADPVGLISYALWQTRFAGSESVIGQSLRIDGRPMKIIGVLRHDFETPTLAEVDVLVPQKLNEPRQALRQTMAYVRVYARLKPGVTLDQARASLIPLFDESMKFVPPQFKKEVRFRMTSFLERQVRDSKTAMLVLFGAVLCVLLVACANVANLMLARAASRQREMAVRASIGASRSRLLRQRLTEHLLLSTLAGLAGIGLSMLLLKLFRVLAPLGLPRLTEATLDGRVLLFTALMCVLSAVLSGVAPAFTTLRMEALSSRSGSPARPLLRQVLAASQIALSVVLLSCAGLLLRSLWALEQQDLGISSDHVLVARLAVNGEQYREPRQRHVFFDAVEQRLRSLPGVEVVALADSMPPLDRTQAMIFSRIQKEGIPLDPRAPTGGMVTQPTVSPGYFKALRIPLDLGRAFNEDDRNAPESLLVIDHNLAQRLYGNDNAIGRRLRLGMEGPWHTIVGVARSALNAGLDKASDPEYYLLQRRDSEIAHRRQAVVIRTVRDPQLLAKSVRAEVAAVDPTLPVDMETLDSRIHKLTARPRFNATLLLMFAIFGMTLAAIGLAAVITYLVSQRTREIGVRMAVGATSGEIRAMVLGQSLRWTIAGAAAGLAGAMLAGRWLGSLLFGVKPNDPVTLSSVTLILLLVGLGAAWIPARMASRLDPMSALRQD